MKTTAEMGKTQYNMVIGTPIIGKMLLVSISDL